MSERAGARATGPTTKRACGFSELLFVNFHILQVLKAWEPMELMDLILDFLEFISNCH